MPHPKHSRLAGLALLSLLTVCGTQCSRPSGGGAASTGAQSLQAAEELMKKRELDQAASMLVELARDPAAPALVHQRLAEIYVARNDLPKAVKTLREGLDRPGKSPELALLLSRIYMKLEQYKDAQATLERARSDGAAEKDVAMLLGTCLGQQGDLAGAEREFLGALDAGYEPKVVKYNLALILNQRGEYVRAKQLLEAALAIDPKWSEARRELAHVMLLSEKDAVSVNKALDMLIDAKDQLQGDWHVFEYIGDAWLLLGDFEASLAAYTDALRLGRNPKSVEDKYVVAKRKLNELREKQKEAVKPDAQGASSTPQPR